MTDVSALRCKESFSFDKGNIPVVFRRGDIVASDDPRIKGKEQMFEPAIQSVRAVETASAAPGEARTLTTPRKKS